MKATDKLLAFAVSVYVLAVILAASMEGLSRLAHVGVLLMLLALALRAGRSSLRLRGDPLLYVFWMFFLLALASVLWAPNGTLAAVRVSALLVDVLGATLVWVALWNGLSLRWLAATAGLAASVQAIVAMQQFLTSDSPERVTGLVDNPNALAMQLSLVAFLLLVAGGRSWLPGALALALILVATVTSGSRKMVFVWLTYMLLLSRWLALGLRRSAVTAAALLLLLPIAMLVAIENHEAWLAPVEDLTVYQRMERAVAGEDNSANVRGDLIGEAFTYWTASPVWGHGMDQFRVLTESGLYSHNNYTELLANLGLVGLVLFYSIHGSLTLRALGNARRNPRQSWLIVMFVIMLLLLDVARVSHTDRLTWTLFSVMGWVCQRSEDTAPRDVQTTGDRHAVPAG